MSILHNLAAQSNQPTKNTEYVVILETVETDEFGIGWERKVSVSFDDEVNWDNWLDNFNELEPEKYWITEVIEVGDTYEF